MNPDVWLFHVINDWVGQVPALDWIARVLVNDFMVPTTMALAAVWLWFAGTTDEEKIRNRRSVVLIALGILFANALIKDLSYVYFRPRPFAVDTVKLLFYRPSVSSFPSVPIAVAACFAAGAWYANPRAGRLLAMLGTLYGLARVYAGVHYPSDIVGGAVIGAGFVFAIQKMNFLFEPVADYAIRLAQLLYMT